MPIDHSIKLPNMMLPRHNYRSHKEASAENRLIFETLQTAEEQHKSLIENVLQSETTTDAQLDQLAGFIQKNKPRNAIGAARETFEKLDNDKKLQVQRNINRLDARITALQANDQERAELKATIVALRGQQNVAPETAIEPQPEPATLAEKAGNAMKKAGKGLADAAEQITDTILPTSLTKEMSREKKIVVASLMTVGVGVVLWSLFRRARRAFGQGKEAAEHSKGGFLKKWAIRLGVGVAVLFGAKMLLEHFFPETMREAGKVANEVGSKALKGGKEGASKVGENFHESFEFKNRADFKSEEEYYKYLAEQLQKKGAGALDRKNFKSDAEYAKAMEGMLEEYRKQGGNWALVGNSILFISKNGTDAVIDTGTFWYRCIQTIVTDPQNLEKWGDVVEIYGEGFVLYASSFAVMDAAFWSLALGPKAGLVKAGVNTIAWPVTIVRKGTRVAALLIPGKGQKAAIIESRAAVQGMKSGYNRLRLREWNPFSKWSPELVEELFEEWRAWRNIDFDLSKFPEAKALTGHYQHTLMEKLKDGVTDLVKKQGIIPDFLKNPEGERLAEWIKSGKNIDSRFFEDTLQRSYIPTSTENVATPKGASVVDDVDAAFANKIGDALEEGKLDDYLKKLGISDEMRTQVLADKTARDMVKGAAASGDVAEETRIVRMIQKGSKLRAAGIGGGMALSGLGLYMAYAEFVDNKEKMTQTSNPELQKIYAQTNMLVSVDAGVQAVGIVVDGVALYQAATGTIICSAAAPIGLALLPITAGVMMVREGYRQSAHLQEYFVTTERDLTKMPPHQILAHIEGSKPMESTNGMQAFISTLSLKDAKTQQDANLNSRVNGYRAYFAQSAQGLIPHPTAADVRALRNMGNEEVADEDIKTLYKDWMSQYVLEAENSIRQLTNGQFYLVDTDVLNQVRSEAFAKWMSRRWGQKMEGKTYRGQEIDQLWREDIVAQAKDPDTFIRALPAYILRKTEVADALAFTEREFAGLDFMSAKEKQIARANLLYAMRQEMQTFVSKIDQKHETSAREIDYLVYSLKELMRGAWNKKTISGPMTTLLKEMVDHPTVLCAPVLEQYIEKYPLRPIYNKTKPQQTNTTNPAYPTPKSNNAI